jgi:hypothetical protein
VKELLSRIKCVRTFIRSYKALQSTNYSDLVASTWLFRSPQISSYLEQLPRKQDHNSDKRGMLGIELLDGLARLICRLDVFVSRMRYRYGTVYRSEFERTIDSTILLRPKDFGFRRRFA